MTYAGDLARVNEPAGGLRRNQMSDARSLERRSGNFPQPGTVSCFSPSPLAVRNMCPDYLGVGS